MTADEKLTAILAAVQTDPGNRGLARDPHDNLFTATAGDFQAACRSLADHPEPVLGVVTGFYIPAAMAGETDGPLGAVFLARAFDPRSVRVQLATDPHSRRAIRRGLRAAGRRVPVRTTEEYPGDYNPDPASEWAAPAVLPGHIETFRPTHTVALERCGRAADGRYYTMRGTDVTKHAHRDYHFFPPYRPGHEAYPQPPTIGIGDGGNEIGMGKVPHEMVAKNIPNGHLIHCRVPTDHLIVAGVSNWGAYALAAGVYVLRGVKPPPDLFDPDREREILEVMVREGPLVDGVTGKQTATVDGLTWDEYARPIVRIRAILEA